jgi:hypothetical protein
MRLFGSAGHRRAGGAGERLRALRTNLEACVYVQLQLCECGASLQWDANSLSGHPARRDLAISYTGTCPSCGNQRKFPFLLPNRLYFASWANPGFSRPEQDQGPSELVDPGQWMWVADRFTENTPPRPDGRDPATYRTARRDLRAASAAISEVLKFIPKGAESVPLKACWTEEGRNVYERSPARFHRSRLEVLRDTYREMSDRFPG